MREDGMFWKRYWEHTCRGGTMLRGVEQPCPARCGFSSNRHNSSSQHSNCVLWAWRWIDNSTSNAESIMKREKHVATRIIQFVKSELFRRIKFDKSAEMFQKAFVKVLSSKGSRQTIMCFFSWRMKVVLIRPWTRRGVLVSNRVPKLHGKQLPISKNAE